jgi:Resolvase, N terminal domain
VRIVGYVRVSTRQQTLGDSLEAQEKAIREWAEGAGHVVVAIIEDGGESGKLAEDQRPGLLAALSMIEAGEADALAVQRLDRLARALHVQEAVLARAWLSEAEVWEAVGARLVLQDDSDDPMRTFVRQVMGAANQLGVNGGDQATRRSSAQGGTGRLRRRVRPVRVARCRPGQGRSAGRGGGRAGRPQAYASASEAPHLSRHRRQAERRGRHCEGRRTLAAYLSPLGAASRSLTATEPQTEPDPAPRRFAAQRMPGFV